MEANAEHILEILIGAGLINEEFAGKIVEKMEETGDRVIDVITDSGLVTRMEMIETLASHQGMEAIHLDPDNLDPMILVWCLRISLVDSGWCRSTIGMIPFILPYRIPLMSIRWTVFALP